MFTLTFGSYTFPNQTFEVESETLDMNIKEQNLIQYHGSFIETPFLKSKKFKIKGYLHNTDEATTEQQLYAMNAALFDAEAFFQHRDDKKIKCFAKKCDGKYLEGLNKSVLEMDIELVSQSPFYISTGASTSQIEACAGITTEFYVNNEGNADTDPRIYIHASGETISDNIKITNIESGKYSQFRGEIPYGLTLEFNSEDLEVWNNSIDGLSYFEGNFLSFQPGNNLIQVVGATCTVTIEYKKKWYA